MIPTLTPEQLTVLAIVVLILAAVLGGSAAYKYGGRVAVQRFLTRLFVVMDTVWLAVDKYNQTDVMSNEQKLKYVLEVGMSTAKEQKIDGLLSEKLLLLIVEGAVTLTKRKPPDAIGQHNILI